eukprot:13330260-Alexandrium_andersonii.AAC.1
MPLLTERWPCLRKGRRSVARSGPERGWGLLIERGREALDGSLAIRLPRGAPVNKAPGLRPGPQARLLPLL